MDILEFKGPYRWLSNFWPVQVLLDGVVYPSVEHAYQAAKTHPSHREPFRHGTAVQAKRLGRTVKIQRNWESIKLQIMRGLIAQKFAEETELGKKLKETGDCQIVEGNHWGDTFWGVCRGNGQNWLGRLIMQQRTLLTATKGEKK